MNTRRTLVWSLLCVFFTALHGCGGCQQQTSPIPPNTTTDAPAVDPIDTSDKPADPPFVPEDATDTTEPEPDETAPESGSDDPFESDPEPGSSATEPTKDESPTDTTKDETTSADETEESDEPAAPDESEAESAAASDAAETVVTGDWPCWGSSIARNMVSAATGVSIDFQPAEDPKEAKKMLWTARLGSQTYGNPVIAGGKVLIASNNGAEYRPKHEGDRGCLLCFDEKTGKFLWQLTRNKIEEGMALDWPDVGICSTPFIEGDRVWLVTNRCELVCLDIQGFYDDENDGPYTDEVDTEKQDADIVWILDMLNDLGVRPHNQATCSPAVYEDMVCVLTSNGVDEETHEEIPAPEAPSFLGVDKKTGKVAWQDNTPSAKVLHGQWSSPAIGVVNGQAQVYMPGGDGWLYALDVKTGEHIWKFDLNPKDAIWKEAGRGDRNSVIATPVFYENSVVLGAGQDPEHGDGVGHLYRIDATKKGDLSPQTPDGTANPNSGQIWHLGGIDEDGSQTGEKGAEAFRRTMSTVAIHDGLVYAPDLSGRIHCVDFETGKRYWEADLLATVWGSPLIADGKMFIGNEDGILTVFATGKELKMLAEIECESTIYGTPAIANGVLFINDNRRLYAIAAQ